MSENIKVSEVSDILRHQLEGIDTRVQLDEIGTVLQVSDGVARIYGLRNAEANELLEFDNGIKAIVMNLEEDNVGAVLLGPTDKIKEGYVVKRTKRIASIMVGECSWEVALVIPYSAFFMHNITSLGGKTIRANFYKCGDKLQTPHFLSWSPIDLEKPNFHCPEFFGELHFE